MRHMIVLNTLVRTRLLMSVARRRGELQQLRSDCRRVKWCPCTLDVDDVSTDDVSKLLIVTDRRTVSIVTICSFWNSNSNKIGYQM